ncbi:MAG: DUF429 domain-containing protein [Acidimicrobiia bacterium]|nr:DUF429 domain-containing protein [Acidimicrobiia bacterium]
MSGRASHPVVVGADGCRGGWLLVWTGGELGSDLTAERVDDLGPIVDRVRDGEVAVLAVDMPIGLLADRPRPCDIAARVVLGHRRSTVFPAPVRATLAADDYDEACRLSRRAHGKALSKQAYNLLPAIRRLDQLLEPGDAASVVEAHPECAFARLAGEPLPSKHTVAGRERRLGLLDDAYPNSMSHLAANAGGRSLPLVDLIDAAVLTVTARHVVAGSAVRLGGDLDPTGKPAQILY